MMMMVMKVVKVNNNNFKAVDQTTKNNEMHACKSLCVESGEKSLWISLLQASLSHTGSNVISG